MQDDATPLTPAATPTTGKALVVAPPKDAAPEGSSAGPMLGGLVLAVLAVVAFVLTRRRARLSRRMELLESLSLGPRRSVCLVRVEDRVLVMGVSEAGVQLLTTHDAPEPIEPIETSPAASAEPGFAQLLGESIEAQALRARLVASQRGGP